MDMHPQSQMWAEVAQTQQAIQSEWSQTERRERQGRAVRRQLGLLSLLTKRGQERRFRLTEQADGHGI